MYWYKILFIILVVVLFYLLIRKREHLENINPFDKIDAVLYINLENRPDRKDLLLQELTKLNIPANKIYKISGVPIPKNGHKGCIQSHLLALNLIKMNNWKRILILEDDAELNVNINDFNNQLNQINKYIDNNNWDVVMLATANATKTNINGEKNIVKLTNATTSSAYIINKNYVDKLVPLFNYANNMMVSEEWSEGSHERYALDQIWRDMQNKDIWLGFDKDLIKQREIKSSINNRI